MRPAFVSVLGIAAACSSATPVRPAEPMPMPSEDRELMSTRPRPAVPAPPADEPAIEIVVDEAAAPAALPPVAACVPPAAGARFALEPAALRACWNRGGDFSAPVDACVWVGRDGAAWSGDPPAAAPAAARPTAAIDESGATAQVCSGAGACVTLAPELGDGRRIRQAVIDDEGARAAVLLAGGDAETTVEIYDARAGGRLAAGTRRRRGAGEVEQTIAFFGPAVLWVRAEDDGAKATGELWKTHRAKLKLRKKLRGQIGDWGAIGAGRFVVTDGARRAQIWDAHRAHRLDKLELDELGEDAAESMLVTADGAFAMVILTRAAGRAAIVDVEGRRARATAIDLPVCE